jgi:hypothetical protein
VNADSTIRVTGKALARLHDIQHEQAAARGRRVTMAEVIEILTDNYEKTQADQGGNPR